VEHGPRPAILKSTPGPHVRGRRLRNQKGQPEKGRGSLSLPKCAMILCLESTRALRTQEFSYSIEEAFDCQIIRFRGDLTGTVDFSKLPELKAPVVVLDLGTLVHSDPDGIVAWSQLLERLGFHAQVYLERCPSHLVKQLYLRRDILNLVRIRSVFIDYCCGACGRDHVQLVTLESKRAVEIPRELPCRSCGSTMVTVDEVDAYERFLTDCAQTTDLVDPLIGVVLDGGYEIIERIGTGGMGAVYRAKQRRAGGRDVAVKLIDERLAGSEKGIRRFENEAKIIADLRHPNTLKLFDVGRTKDSRLFIVTEFLTGSTLHRMIASGPLPPERVLKIVQQICYSLREAHAQGIVHRDLKPANVMIETVGKEEIVKVLDFGMAKFMNQPGLTAIHDVCGTPGYMSPEQARGQPVDPRADLYALGAIAYECLSGCPMFRQTAAFALIQAQLSSDPPSLKQLAPFLSDGLCAFVAKLVCRDRTQRFQNADEVLSAIDALRLTRLVSRNSPSAERTDEILSPWAAQTEIKAEEDPATPRSLKVGSRRESGEKSFADETVIDQGEQTRREKTERTAPGVMVWDEPTTPEVDATIVEVRDPAVTRDDHTRLIVHASEPDLETELEPEPEQELPSITAVSVTALPTPLSRGAVPRLSQSAAGATRIVGTLPQALKLAGEAMLRIRTVGKKALGTLAIAIASGLINVIDYATSTRARKRQAIAVAAIVIGLTVAMIVYAVR
jgi:serine/threonine protein kinase